ncbi:hypothetical protein CA13_62970 [Planctomycetes bacterium CA13]|uniref:Uncharacterized protein n=1 Tax=Novipirellula herctigrandis TaxID=2527986 RepID=A0A5C5ZCD3_9BACT|nr:hypothetical protein CA13_62970 [Planctomycetes bacterium CA13]
MRLTLRTLLAYLDNTLEPADAESLRAKVAESGFAGQLVQRIRDTITSGHLAAPAPDAVGPVEEANMISEYLDSTLPTEQVAEIERACLESDTQLAEAAACHQILTMVLGKTADVSPALRHRIYELPDREIADIASAGSFASVSMPDADPTSDGLHDLEGIDVAETVAPSSSMMENEESLVQPVGPADSGVSDAPTRIRQSDAQDQSTSPRDGTMAGNRPRSALEAAQLYGGTIRTNRMAPWLVSFALAAALLFALVQIFEPLLNRGKLVGQGDEPLQSLASDADRSEASASDAVVEPTEEIEVPPELAPEMIPVDEAARSMEPDNVTETEESYEDLPLPAPEPERTEPNPSELESITQYDEMPTPDVEPETDADAPPPVDPSVPQLPSDSEAPPAVDEVGGEGMELIPGVSGSISPTAGEPDSDMNAPPMPAGVMDADSELGTADESEIEGVAKVTTDSGLLIGLGVDGGAFEVNRNDVVTAGQTLVCAPTYRVRLDTSSDVAVTLIGPARIHWSGGGTEELVLHVEHGRALLEGTKAGADLNVVVGATQMNLSFPNIETLVALTTAPYRQSGFDPVLPENHVISVGVLVPQGESTLSIESETIPLSTGDRWVKRGSEADQKSAGDSIPNWISPPNPNDRSLEAAAREALLSLMVDGQSAEKSLREATMFRRAEVGALAARTLLSIRRPDVYFGGDGVLNNPEQRLYWVDHYASLVAAIDRDAETSNVIKTAIVRMDSANAQALYKLLVGYSPKQLAEGGDAELVSLLDSPSMAVRSLALENLRKITGGATLGYRPEQDSSARRSQAIKKWEVRLRKGDIRMPME